jgi:hypothetical protein
MAHANLSGTQVADSLGILLIQLLLDPDMNAGLAPRLPLRQQK